MRTLVRHYRVPLSHIAYVRAIVESYDGVATVSSTEAGSGALVWSIPESLLADAQALAAALAIEVGMMEVEAPQAEAPAERY
jgi:hypothetical protein